MDEPGIDLLTPVLVGVGQVTRHWRGREPDDAAGAPSPRGLLHDAARAAVADARGDAIVAAIDTVAVIRSMADSVEDAPQPFGRMENPPGTLAADLGITGARHVYSVVGGDQPQALVNEFAGEIAAGRARAVLIAGAEATGTLKQALKHRLRLDWQLPASAPVEDRGLGAALLSAYERRNGLGAPTQTYPVFEHALRVRLGLDRDRHVALMSTLWEGFAAIAAANPHAQFPIARTREFLATPGPDNYPVADPYLKWHVAQDAVNQAAAVILTSIGEARARGIAAANQVYLHGHAAARDRPVTQREDLSRSRAIEAVLAAALAMAGKRADEIALFDLYSCFPCAVLLAAEALGLDWRRTVPTVTGGLPFFGGPGNSYSLHAIATMAERLRAAPGSFGLVLANGGFLSKEAAGIYSTTPAAWRASTDAAVQALVDAQVAPPLLAQSTQATVETFTVTYARGKPSRGFVIAATPEGRILARVRTGHRATLAALAAHDPVGTTVRITHADGVNWLDPDDRLGVSPPAMGLVRRFADLTVARHGHVLEVTLDRPASRNALHSAHHFALHEIWDAFEADPDLWVAIVTGAGDRAFCSGNDLKVTAQGGDMAMPASGFAGLSSRFDRTKPIIAAVNGVAMGGGLEIVLACDLAIADARATLALPEVKVGLFAAAGGVHRLIQQIGRKAAMELILTGRAIDAAEGARLGIVNAVVPDGTCLARARELAAAITANSPTAIRASLVAIGRLDTAPTFADALAANGEIIARLMRTQDFREGVTAFAEKRAPNWTGA